MIVVSNASPLIALSHVGLLDVLHMWFGSIYVPVGVWDEVVTQGEGRPGTEEVVKADWIVRREVQDEIGVCILQERLDRGESEAIVLAMELEADLVLLDDKRGRAIARARGLKVVGTLGVLLYAKEVGRVESVGPLMDRLILAGFRVSPQLYAAVLTQASETETNT